MLSSIDISATSISKKWIIFTRQLLWHIGSVINERYSCKHAILVMKSHSDLLYDWFGNLVFSGSAWNEMKSCWTSFEYPQCTRRKKNLQPQRLASEQLNDLSLRYYSLCQNSTFLFFLIWLKYLILQVALNGKIKYCSDLKWQDRKYVQGTDKISWMELTFHVAESYLGICPYNYHIDYFYFFPAMKHFSE